MRTDGAHSGAPLLEVRGIRKAFATGGLFGPKRRVIAAEDVSFRLDRGQAIALVGESGSGKSTVARLLLRLEPPNSGEIRLDGEDVLVREPRRASLGYRKRVQMVFQDPFGSLNPAHDVRHHLVRPLVRHGCRQQDATAHALELLRTVGLVPPEDFIARHPYELSGGQRQRVAIARALAVDPDVLVADEPTSMLDVSIRMGILQLLGDLKQRRGLAILLITHDLASARHLADRILVLFRGRVVESGPARQVVDDPVHPYTRALIAAVADENPVTAKPQTARIEVKPGEAGCPFVPRCPEVLEHCGKSDPQPRAVRGRQVRCHLYPEELKTNGSSIA